MKRKYIVPAITETMVDAWTTFLDNLSFTIGDDPHGGWSDAKERVSQEWNDTTCSDPWANGLW